MRIQQISDTEWQILDDADNPAGDVLGSYAEAVAFLGGMMAYAATLAADEGDDEGATSTDGLLEESWTDVAGIAFSTDTGDGRNFTNCTWTARDPQVSLLPLMLQTSTEMGHFGAVLAGFIETIGNLGAGTTPTAAGRFYDSEAGRQFRDLLLDGRRFGVSVDPGAVEAEWVCVETDEDGWCVEENVDFLAYEVIGLTGTPFPAWGEAAIQLAGAAASGDEGEPVAAAASRRRSRPPAETAVDRNHPPIEWLRTAEPRLGEPFAFGDLGDEWLVEQTDDGRLAMPLTILDSGRFAGHLAYWGQCHIAWPGGPEVCVTPPRSEAAYSKFHVGETVCADGTRLATGVMTASCDHALRGMRAPEARDSYANNGMGWGRARVSNGQFGPWCSGVLQPDVTADQLAVLRGGTLSGDWRYDDDFGGLQLIASLAVNHGGFPIAREAITASGWNVPTVTRPQVQVQDGRVVTLIASGLVRRCPDCAKRAAARRNGGGADLSRVLGDVQRTLAAVDSRVDRIDRRTRHLVAPAAEYAAARIRNGN